ncbi:hypothetical protein B0T25DRAFT_609811 [Lasiosphaeria hispida]|uniref:non-specific serine/threonine protein kinase n=1 Tax=Lasiosphaeria hispida TaxID=260671 RepID=A0AAJ0HEL5_9PEZI|nr:hypothetical protein B0T25DRAFT_609811 [Lasiosphaeria hispida]
MREYYWSIRWAEWLGGSCCGGENPIGNGLDASCALFNLICKGMHISCTLDALEQLGRDGKAETITFLYASCLLCSSGSGKNLFMTSSLLRLNSAVNSNDFDLNSIKPLLRSVIASDNDALIWKEVYNMVTEPTPLPQPIAPSLQQTLWLHNTGSFANSSEYCQDVDRVLGDELGVIDVNQDDVLSWFAELTQPNKLIRGLTMECVDRPQDTCCFVLGFTICGSFMRIWEFDWLGGLASEQFDINEDGLWFVMVLGFLWMNEEELGFDLTFIMANGQWFIKIEWNGLKECLIIDKYLECGEEGVLLYEVTSKGIINITRHYYHEMVPDTWNGWQCLKQCHNSSVATGKKWSSSQVSTPLPYRHESLCKAGILHRDISINNLLINKDTNNPSWPLLLINLDLTIKMEVGILGAKEKTGIRAFIVLFWICIYCKGPVETRVIKEFDKWNYMDTIGLVKEKKGKVSYKGDFIKSTKKNFTFYYQPLIPWVNQLCKAMFLNDRR